MNHLGTARIETNRLILRRFEMSDAQAMYRNWANDDEVTKFLMWPSHSSVGISEIVLDEWVNNYADNSFYQWAIVLKEYGNEPIGSIAVVHMNEKVDGMEIGYCIGRKWWRQGIMSEALSGVIRFLIKQVGAKRIEARHDPKNPNSGKVMLKCGLRYEGTLRQASYNNQGTCDLAVYGLLADEYLE